MTYNTPFSTVGYITYKRTYARRLNEGDPKSSTEEFSQLAYTVSLGEEKDRLTVTRGNSGTRLAASSTWAMSPFVTANTDLHSILASRGDTQAEAVRLIQIRIDQYKMSDLQGSEVTSAMKMIELNMGAAGEEYIKYVVAHLDEVLAIMAKWGKRIEKDVPDSKYRFYRAHAICSMTGLEITNHLKITSFNLDAVYKFALDLFSELADVVSQQNTITPEDALNRMVTDLSPRVITTTEYRDARDGRGPEEVKYNSNNAPVGRYITGNVNTKDNPLSGKLFLSRKDVRKGLEGEYIYCEDWTDAKAPRISYQPYNPITRESKQLYYCQFYRPGEGTYPLPDYVGALKYIEVDTEISNYYSQLTFNRAPVISRHYFLRSNDLIQTVINKHCKL